MPHFKLENKENSSEEQEEAKDIKFNTQLDDDLQQSKTYSKWIYSNKFAIIIVEWAGVIILLMEHDDCIQHYHSIYLGRLLKGMIGLNIMIPMTRRYLKIFREYQKSKNDF